MPSQLPSQSARAALIAIAVAAATTLSYAPTGAQAPGDPVWGTYAAGVGYAVGSPALMERAEREGIDPRCLMTLTVAWTENPRIAENLAAGLLRVLVQNVTLAEAQRVMYENSPYINPEIDCVGSGSGNGGAGLSPGFYAVRVSGSGFIKRYGGTVLRQTGSHVSIISVTERGGGVNVEAGRTFADLVAQWQAERAESSERSCAGGPPPPPTGSTPHIWVSGPHYELLAGPAPAGEIRQRFGCEPAAGWRICLRWESESLRYSDLPPACR